MEINRHGNPKQAISLNHLSPSRNIVKKGCKDADELQMQSIIFEYDRFKEEIEGELRRQIVLLQRNRAEGTS